MGEDSQRTDRLENRNLLQLEEDLANFRRDLDEQLGLLSETVLLHETALDRVNNVMTDNHCRGPNVPLTPFHGNRNEDFAQYVKQFELICTANNYAADKRAQILGSYLRDKAFFIYDSLPDATKADYALLKAALNDKFQTADHRRYAHQKFQGRKQLPTESVPDYACDLHRMGLSALVDVESDQRDALIREKFIAGLLPHLRELIVYSNPTSFHEALTLAERLEGLQAAKTDSTAKNVLLLENISDRLANLEVKTHDSSVTNVPQEVAYVMDAPNRRAEDGFAIQRKFNLGNYRQEFRPSGMVCFKCNKTGHMARNCFRTRNMNAVVCRLCNRMGHFARNCQRRGASLARRVPTASGNRSLNRGSFTRAPLRTDRPARTMATTISQMEVGCEGGEEPTEFVRWKPLIATMFSNKYKRQRMSCEPRDSSEVVRVEEIAAHNVPESVTDPLEPQEPVLEENLISPPKASACSETAEISLITPTAQGIIGPAAAAVGRALSAFQHRVAPLCCCCLLFMASIALASNADGNYRHSEPMLCQAFEGKALWKLPTTFSCPEGNHSMTRTVVPTKFRLYKRNYVQYKSQAWKCVRLTEEVRTFSYFFGDENLKKVKKFAEAVSAEDCVRMKNFKMCKNQPMIFQSGIYQTSNKVDWYYPGGGINCCHWKTFTVTNCFMYTSHVYKRHGSTEMESTAGKVNNCKYQSGQCVLSDGSFLLWDVKNKSFCEVLPWKKLKGQMCGTSWLSDDSNLALTFTKQRRTVDCRGRPLVLSDQGIPVKSLKRSRRNRSRRQLRIKEIQNIRNVVGGGGVVSSAQLASSLQALELRWEQNMQFAFSHALNNVCNFMRSVIELLKTQVLANPTMAVRALTNQTNIFAKSGGNIIEVFPCTQLNHFHYQFKPMNGTCSAQLPIKFYINNKTANGFLDPVTNIIHRFSVPTDCNLVKQVPIQLRDKTFLYHAHNGEITPVHDIPELKVFQWNVEPIIDMKATIFHEIVIYNWEELQTHISLNDIIGSLDRQRTILHHIGISDQETNPQKAAQTAVSRIMDMGYFGFLHGLTANIFQVWTFLICLYVTICILIVHCLPVHAMPAALNAGNAARKLKQAWDRWKRHKFRPNRGQDTILESSGPVPTDDEHLSQFTSELLQRINHRRPKAILPATELEMTSPSAPLIEGSHSVETRFGQPMATRPSANVQPFRINVIYPVSETAITVMVEGLAVECLLDTGAMHTVMSTRLAKLLALPINDSLKRLTSVTGHDLPIGGMVQITAQIAGLEMKGKALVTNELPYEIIIGVEFMKQLGDIVINFQKRTMDINGITINMKPAKTKISPSSDPIKKISERAEALTMAEKLKMVRFKPKTYLISPNPMVDEDEDQPLAVVEEIHIDHRGETTVIPCPDQAHVIPPERPDDAEPSKSASMEITKCSHEILALEGSSDIAIDVYIEGMRAKTLVDTGSGLTVIPFSIARMLRNPIRKQTIEIVSMTGHQLEVMGEIDTIIRIGSHDVSGTVVVAEKSPYDLIIGIDLLQQLDAVKVDFKNRTINLGTESVPMSPPTEQTRAIGVYLCQQARIAPKSTIMVMGMCYGLTPAETAEHTPCCFSPSPRLLSKYGVLSQDAVVSPIEKLVPVTVTNCDRAPKFLPEKATLGQLDVLGPEEICALDAQRPHEKGYVATGQKRTKLEIEKLNQEINISENISRQEREMLQDLIGKYEKLFARSDYDLGETKLVEHTIDTGDARPISQKPYRTPHSLRPYLRKKIEQMLDHGIIQPSKSDWSSPVVLVKKKDTTELRFCVDNRKLNDVTIKDNYPLKRIEDAFDILHNSRYFATLDLQSGYWQIPIREPDQSKTAFVTTEGLFEYTKMNFGLCNAPATFQRLMDQVLRGLDLSVCMSYIDDIIVPAHTIPQLVQRLESVFGRLLAAGLKLKLRKCKFGLEELKFLGFIVSKDGLKADPEKIEKILNAKPPTNRDELRTFIGFTGWCKRFIDGYAKIAWPLTDLLKQSKAYKWSHAAQHAFEALKQLYAQPPILAYPNMSAPFVICTDTSNWAIGAVLCQLDNQAKERPISYDSRILNSSERNYSTIEKEMLAIFWAVVKKYRVYVYGHDFTVHTDHKPLLGVWKAPPNEGRLGKWCVRMQEYRPNMILVYRQGKSNVAADYLSRPPQPKGQYTTPMVLVATTPLPDMRKAQLEDEVFGPLLRYVEDGELPKDANEIRCVQKWAPNYEIVNDVLYKRSPKYHRLLIALPMALRSQVLTAHHDSLLGGHLGIRKTLSKIENKFYWPKYYKDVVDWCRGCMACQTRKPPAKAVKAPLQPITVNYINQRWGWDICGPLPLSQQGNRYILVCMEYFTKFPELFPVPDTKAERLAKIFVERIVMRYGCPEVLLSDQGKNVHSSLIQEICKLLDIDKLRTSAYHPQTDGLVERFNRTLHNMISMYVNDGHNDWCEFLPFLEFAYRSSVQETTKETPFFLMYGYDPILPIDLSYMPSHPGYIATDDDYKAYILYALLRSRRLVGNVIPDSQSKQKVAYDKRASDHTFLEGDRVLVYTPTGKKGRSKKFARNWVGPYRVLKVSNNGANIQIQGIGTRRATNSMWIHVNRAQRLIPEAGPWIIPEEAELTHTEPELPVGVPQATDDLTRSGPSADRPPEPRQANGKKPRMAGTRAKETCAICRKRSGDRRWIACDKCLQWHHFGCVGLEDNPGADEWHCTKCQISSPASATLSYVRVPPIEDGTDSDSTIETI